jgi:hypothetical protein
MKANERNDTMRDLSPEELKSVSGGGCDYTGGACMMKIVLPQPNNKVLVIWVNGAGTQVRSQIQTP